MRLGNCLDLLDSWNVKMLRVAYEGMIRRMVALGEEIPRNVRQLENLDCAVFNYLYSLIELEGLRTPDTVRAA